MTSLHNADVRGRFVDGSTHADAAVVVVTYNSASDISLLIDDLRVAAQDRKLRVIIVDNQSSDGTAEIVGAHADVKLVQSGGNLGFAGGINVAMPFTEPCDAVLFLNPDLRLKPDAVTRLLESLVADVRVGAVVPRTLDKDEVLYHSLRYEPSLTRVLGDAFLGSKRWLNRPGILSEFDYRPASYLEAHDDVDWASGAALLVPSVVAREVGAWNEEFFLYSEEVDYFRRIRMSGRRIRFEPSAVVKHRGWGSGRSPAQETLSAVNRVRYIEQYHGRGYSTLFRAAVALAETLRCYDAAHRRTLAVILNRRRWQELPRATKPAPPQHSAAPTIVSPAKREG